MKFSIQLVPKVLKEMVPLQLVIGYLNYVDKTIQKIVSQYFILSSFFVVFVFAHMPVLIQQKINKL